MTNTTYRVSSLVRYLAFGDTSGRLVAVISREDDIKNGRPGFEGFLVNAPGTAVWGYDEQIFEIVSF